MMRIRDQRLRARIRNTPQRRQRLRYRERQIVTGDRTTRAALGLLRLDGLNLDGTRDRPEFQVEVGDALIDAFLHARILPVRLTQRLTGDRVAAHPDQELELRLRNPPTAGELPAAEARQTRPHPEPGRSACFFLVAKVIFLCSGRCSGKGAAVLDGGALPLSK